MDAGVNQRPQVYGRSRTEGFSPSAMPTATRGLYGRRPKFFEIQQFPVSKEDSNIMDGFMTYLAAYLEMIMRSLNRYFRKILS